MGVLPYIVSGMRPRQWVKNGFVIAPLLFASRLGDLTAVTAGLGAFVLFCVLSGAVYLLNDAFDVEADRHHPLKKHRPIAAGLLPVRTARLAAFVLAGSAIIAGLFWTVPFGLILAGYFCLNLAYSVWIKQLPVLDVLAISTGFLLRVIGGGYAIDVPISAWILVCTFLLSLYLGLGKRMHEINLLGAGMSASRPVLRRYNMAVTTRIFHLSGLASAASFAAYTLSARARMNFGTHALVYTVPFVLIGLWRFAAMVNDTSRKRSPTESLVSDPVIIATALLWGGVAIAIIYLPEVFP